MEAERYTNKSENYVLRYLEDSSNGQNMTVDIYTDVKEEYLEYSFNIKDTGRYAIWALSSPGNSLWVCPWKFSVNGGAKTDMLNTAQTGETVYVSTEGRGQPIGWYRLSIIDLNSGLNTLRFIADQGGEGNGIQYHLLDAIAIVPTSFNWTPSGLERPSPAQELPELGGGEPTIGSDYVWIEGENCTRQSGEYVLTTDEEGKQNYSDGSAAVAVVNNPTSPLSLEYEFVLPEANAYQIWLRGTAEGNTVAGTASASTFLWSMDGAEAEPAANGRTQQLYTAANNNQASYQTGVIDSNTTSPMPNYTIAWHYVGTKDLAAGDHTLEILVNDITDDGFYRSLVDCICIVPVNYQWNPMLFL